MAFHSGIPLQHGSTVLSGVPVCVPAEPDAEDAPELFALESDAVDLDEVLETLFVLDMDSKFLCREDCKGLCAQCGANLNDGPCGCKKPIDPRLAVLEQLLDKKDD